MIERAKRKQGKHDDDSDLDLRTLRLACRLSRSVSRNERTTLRRKHDKIVRYRPIPQNLSELQT
jgi:hypothetical protein